MALTTFPTRSDAASTATAGKDYLIYVNNGVSDTDPTWLLIGGQRSGNLNRSADEIDASHKTSGGWKITLPGLRSWNIALEAVVLLGDDGAKYLEAAFNAGRQVHLKFEYPNKTFYTGWGSITDFSLATPHDGVATISGTISGDGPLSELQQPEFPCVLTLSDTSVSVGVGASETVTATASSGGEITATSSDTSVCTVAVSDGVITIQGIAAGTTDVFVDVPATGNYAAAGETIAVTVS